MLQSAPLEAWRPSHLGPSLCKKIDNWQLLSGTFSVDQLSAEELALVVAEHP